MGAHIRLYTASAHGFSFCLEQVSVNKSFSPLFEITNLPINFCPYFTTDLFK